MEGDSGALRFLALMTGDLSTDFCEFSGGVGVSKSNDEGPGGAFLRAIEANCSSSDVSEGGG